MPYGKYCWSVSIGIWNFWDWLPDFDKEAPEPGATCYTLSWLCFYIDFNGQRMWA